MRRVSHHVRAAAVAALLVPLPRRACPLPAAPTICSQQASGPTCSRVDVTVTRTFNGVPVTLPAAAVPALAGRRRRRAVRLHATAGARELPRNVALSPSPAAALALRTQRPWDRLFPTTAISSLSHPRTCTSRTVRATTAIPIFIVPEDAKTRGMDGARDYVMAHATDFKNMSESANDAVNRQLVPRLSAIARSSLDLTSGQQRAPRTSRLRSARR